MPLCCLKPKKKHYDVSLDNFAAPMCVIDSKGEVLQKNILFERDIGLPNVFIPFQGEVNTVYSYEIKSKQYNVIIKPLQNNTFSFIFFDVNMVQPPSIANSLFPSHVISAAMSGTINSMSHFHRNANICFIDIVSFSAMCKDIEPYQIMNYLNCLFHEFDKIAKEYSVIRNETIGDCYIATTGILVQKDDELIISDQTVSPERIIAFAEACAIKAYEIVMPVSHEPTKVRIGIHMGDIVSGVLDNYAVPKFSLYGEAMNKASRMQTTCIPGHIHISSEVYKSLSLNARAKFQEVVTDIKSYGNIVTYMKKIELTELSFRLSPLTTIINEKTTDDSPITSSQILNKIVSLANATIPRKMNYDETKCMNRRTSLPIFLDTIMSETNSLDEKCDSVKHNSMINII